MDSGPTLYFRFCGFMVLWFEAPRTWSINANGSAGG
jgi:hypothetical protein